MVDAIRTFDETIQKIDAETGYTLREPIPVTVWEMPDGWFSAEPKTIGLLVSGHGDTSLEAISNLADLIVTQLDLIRYTPSGEELPNHPDLLAE
jgi:hypothetical protein